MKLLGAADGEVVMKPNSLRLVLVCSAVLASGLVAGACGSDEAGGIGTGGVPVSATDSSASRSLANLKSGHNPTTARFH